jgi:hypothetical protein
MFAVVLFVGPRLGLLPPPQIASGPRRNGKAIREWKDEQMFDDELLGKRRASSRKSTQSRRLNPFFPRDEGID